MSWKPDRPEQHFDLPAHIPAEERWLWHDKDAFHQVMEGIRQAALRPAPEGAEEEADPAAPESETP